MLTIFTDTGIIIALIGVLGTLLKTAIDNKNLVHHQQKESEKAASERKLLLASLLVVLRKLNHENLNGEVDATIQDVEKFLLDASHKNVL